ncbi:MAG: 4-hydroxy-tetrahydrodipicolinate synthase [Christensenellales bacterium]
MKFVFEGSGVAIATPFREGKVDFEAFGRMIDFQVASGTDAIIVLGTTGEAVTLTQEERCEVINFAKNAIANRAKFIVGAGSNNTKTAIENSLLAQKYGADGVLVVTPFYNKCTQNGLVEHYKAISDEINIPIIAYNVPGRTGVNILPETAEKLAEIKNICGIKEASGNMTQIAELCHRLRGKMAVYSGDDGLNLPFMLLGAKGAISVTANILPKKVKELIRFAQKGKFEKAVALHEELWEINKAMFVEVNPIPVKFALSYMKLCENEVRLPLTPLEKKNEQVVINALEKVL